MMTNPRPDEIKAARLTAGLTQVEAGAVVHSPSRRAWQNWERGESKIPMAEWELFLIKTGQKEVTKFIKNHGK